MSDIKIVGYKKIFGLILPDWVSEKMLKAFISGLLSSMVMLLVYVFVINPKFEIINELKKGLESDKQELVALRQSRDGINRLQTDMTDVQLKKTLSAVPTNYSPDKAIFILRDIASQTGASIVSYSLPSGVLLDTNITESIGKKGEMVDFSSYPVKMVVAAPVDILLKFIAKVESSLPFGVVADLNLQEVTKLSKASSNKNVQITLEIKYYQARLNKININKIKSLSENDLTFAEKLEAYDEVLLNSKDLVSTESSQIASSSGDIFGL